MTIQTVNKVLLRHHTAIEKTRVNSREKDQLLKALECALEVVNNYSYLLDIEKQCKGVKK